MPRVELRDIVTEDDVEAISGLRLPIATEREVESALRDFLRIAMDRDARSLAFLDEIRTPEAAARHARHEATVAAREAAEADDVRDGRSEIRTPASANGGRA